MLATDLNPESMALPYALSLAQEFQALLTVVHMVPLPEQRPREFEQVIDGAHGAAARLGGAGGGAVVHAGIPGEIRAASRGHSGGRRGEAG